MALLCALPANWRHYSILFGPSVGQSIPERSLINAHAPAPFLHVQRFAVSCQHAVIALVCALLQARGPSDVPRNIVPVHVYPFKRMVLRWFRANVGKEVLEVVPRQADFNAATSIPRVGFRTWSGASRNHVFPSGIFGAFVASWGRSVLPRSFRWATFSVQAAAGFGIPPAKVHRPCFSYLSAVAQASANQVASLSPSNLDNRQSAIALSWLCLGVPMHFHGQNGAMPVVDSQPEPRKCR